jgi:hypothetical protein
MQILNITQVQQVSGGDGHFRVIVNAKISSDCAEFVSNMFEKVLTEQINEDEFDTILFASNFNTYELDMAVAGIDVIFWK